MVREAVTGVPGLDERLGRGRVLILDGGTGTELEAGGVPAAEAWGPAASLEHADALEQAHLDYLAAGADILVANTFGTGLFDLEAADLAGEFEVVNRRAVEAAVRARERGAAGRPVAVAASVAPLAAGAGGNGEQPASEALRSAYRRQAAVLADAGADLLVAEMVTSVDAQALAVRAAAETGLATWVGLSAAPVADHGRVPAHDDRAVALVDLLDELDDLPACAVAIMHTDVDILDDALAIVRRRWRGPIAASPHHGRHVAPSWAFDELDPAALSRRAEAWVDRGVRIVGGCCGIRPAHIERLRDDLRGPES